MVLLSAGLYSVKISQLINFSIGGQSCGRSISVASCTPDTDSVPMQQDCNLHSDNESGCIAQEGCIYTPRGGEPGGGGFDTCCSDDRTNVCRKINQTIEGQQHELCIGLDQQAGCITPEKNVLTGNMLNTMVVGEADLSEKCISIGGTWISEGNWGADISASGSCNWDDNEKFKHDKEEKIKNDILNTVIKFFPEEYIGGI